MKCAGCGERIQWYRVGRVLHEEPDIDFKAYALVDDEDKTVGVTANQNDREVASGCLDCADEIINGAPRESV